MPGGPGWAVPTDQADLRLTLGDDDAPGERGRCVGADYGGEILGHPRDRGHAVVVAYGVKMAGTKLLDNDRRVRCEKNLPSPTVPASALSNGGQRGHQL